MSEAIRYRPDIDGLRAIAVLPVVLFHVGLPGFSGGFVGVDIFFVISGYLITGIIARELEKGRFTVVGFYERRVRRIFPALFVMLFVTAAVAWVVMMPLDFREFSESVAATALFSSNLFFWLKSDYFDQAAELKPLLHTWSLAVEEQYYLIFPPLMAFIYGRFRRWRSILVGIAAASLVLGIVLVRVNAGAAFYLPFSRTWELLIGAMLAVDCLPRLANRLLREILALLGLAAIAFCVHAFNAGTLFPGEAALLPCLAAALIIHANAAGPTLVGRLLSTAPLVSIGLVSFSLYLWHWPVLAFARYCLMRPLGQADQVVLLAAAVGLAYLSWWFVERPFRTGQVRRADLFAGAGALIAATFVIGVVGHVYRGLPERLPRQVRAYAQAAEDINPRRAACDRPGPDRVIAGDACRIGADVPGPPTFAVLGDSFGDAMIPGVEAAARAAGRKGVILTYSGCYALIGVDQGNANCKKHLAASLSYLQRTPSIDRVLLIGRWTTAVSGTRFGAIEDDNLFLTDPLSTERSHDENRRVFDRAVARTITDLRPRKVFVVAYIPEQAVDVPRAAALESYLRQAPEIGVARAVYDRRQAPVRAVLERQARSLGFVILDAGSRLCDARSCPALRDGRILYADDNHLSRTGALDLLDLLAPALPRTDQ